MDHNHLFILILFFFLCFKASKSQVISEEFDSSVCTVRRGSIKCKNEICSFKRGSLKCTDQTASTPKSLEDIDASNIDEVCLYLGDTVDKTLPFWNQPADVLKKIEVFVEKKYFKGKYHAVVSNQNLSDYNKKNCKLRFHTPWIDWLVYNLAIPSLCIFVFLCMTISSRPE
jgi:hypothetical protein